MIGIELCAVGAPRQTVLSLPERLTITVTRDDGYAPSIMEMATALQIALETLREEGKSLTTKSNPHPTKSNP
jgi:predicted component of type VI protein secretion system